MKYMTSFVLTILTMLCLASCNDSRTQDQAQQEKPRITQTTTANVAEKYISKNLIIDVRETKEIMSGMLPNAVHIPLGSLQSELPKYLQSTGNTQKDQSIALYCHSGGRSTTGANILQQLGYSNAVSMQGGIKAWSSEKRNIVTPTQK